MLLQGKRALVFGIANKKSIALGIAQELKRHGAALALSYAGESVKKRIEPLAEELDADFLMECDLSSDDDIAQAANTVQKKWGGIDILVHSVAFARMEDLGGRFLGTTRQGFALALDISAYSLTALCRAFEPIMNPAASIITMTYLGSEKTVRNYNIMGVAKAALEASVRYLALDLGEKSIRINSISAGPVNTLAAKAISGFRDLVRNSEERSPLKRNVDQSEIGKAAVWLASDLASGVTGQTIFVDAGFSITAF